MHLALRSWQRTWVEMLSDTVSHQLSEDYGIVPIASAEIMHDRDYRVTHRAKGPARVVSFDSSSVKEFCGVQAYADALAAGLRQVGPSILLVDVGGASPLKLGKLVREVAQRHPDVVWIHYPSWTFGRGLLPLLFSLVQRTAPLVVTIHEFSQLHPLRRLYIMFLGSQASAVVSTTLSECHQLERWSPWLKGRTRVIPICNFIPHREWCPEDPPLVVYLGQIRPEKGLEDFFACFDELGGGRFAIIGSSVPKFESYWKAINSEAERRGIPVMSGMTDDQVANQLCKATIALLPFPDGATLRRSSLLAAAGCGVPIVTRTGPETPDNMARLLAPADTVKELSDLVRSLLEHPSVRQQSHVRSLELSRLVSWGPIIRDYLSVFESVSR